MGGQTSDLCSHPVIALDDVMGKMGATHLIAPQFWGIVDEIHRGKFAIVFCF
jgi:hypothetical protein